MQGEGRFDGGKRSLAELVISFDFSYKTAVSKLISLIAGQNWMRVIGALESSRSPRGVRELADLTGLSVAGTHDVLRRLQIAGVVERVGAGKRPQFSLTLEAEDLPLLRTLLDRQLEKSLRARAKLFSARVPSALGWIEETLATVRRARAGRTQ